MRLVIDSNIFVSSLDPDDVFYGDTLPVFERLVRGDIRAVCPVIILVETVCVLRRRTGDESRAMSVCYDLTRLPTLYWLDVSLEIAASAANLGARTGIKGSDAIILQTAEQYRIPLLTRDKEFRSRAPKELIVLEPSELR